MDIRLDQQSGLTIEMSPRVSINLVTASTMLEMSSLELQQTIAREVEENPALELVEQALCHVCATPLTDSGCLRCQRVKDITPIEDRFDDSSGGAITDTTSGNVEEDFDPLMGVPGQLGLLEHLTLTMQSIFPTEDAAVIEYLVGNLDEHGYLTCSDETVLQLFPTLTTKHLGEMIGQLQSLEPIGIGARDVRECLLIQVAYLEQEREIPPGVREIITDHLLLLGQHRYDVIARAVHLTLEQVEDAADFIKDQLNPYPAQNFLGNMSTMSNQIRQSIIPDLIINLKEDGSGYDVEVVESRRYLLRIEQSYAQLSRRSALQELGCTPTEKEHVQHYTQRARFFLNNIRQRRETLRKVLSAVVSAQPEFLKEGIRALKPLTRAELATQIGVHESTISRATAGKYVMLPSGKVIPFSSFFKANLSVKDHLAELIKKETKPLSDKELMDALAQRGIKLARRTIAKYREELGILPSNLR